MLFASLDNAVAFYLNSQNQGFEEGNLRGFYLSLRDSVIARPAKFFSSLRLQEDVGISKRPSHHYAWEIYDTETGIAMLELTGDLGNRDPKSNKLFEGEHARGDIDSLSILIYPPLEALEHNIRDLLFDYHTSFREERQARMPYSTHISLSPKPK